MKYRLKFYDSYYNDYRIAFEYSMYELLTRWGCWIDIADEWYIHRIKDDRFILVGRSAKAAEGQ